MTADIPSSEFTEQILEAAATADLITKLQEAGHAVHADRAGGFAVSRWGHSRHCMDFDSLRAFAHQVLGAI